MDEWEIRYEDVIIGRSPRLDKVGPQIGFVAIDTPMPTGTAIVLRKGEMSMPVVVLRSIEGATGKVLGSSQDKEKRVGAIDEKAGSESDGLVESAPPEAGKGMWVQLSSREVGPQDLWDRCKTQETDEVLPGFVLSDWKSIPARQPATTLQGHSVGGKKGKKGKKRKNKKKS